MKKLLAIMLCMVMVVSMAACAAPAAPVEEEAAPVEEVVEEAPVEEAAPEAVVDPNAADYTYVLQPGENNDMNDYYNSKGVECDLTLTSTGGSVNVPDLPTTSIPTPNGDYTIGFSVYYTVDEVGGMILDNMKAFAEEAGVELLVNDANYDQNLQNQAIEQWILEGVDAVIVAPCDFYGVQAGLDALKEAGIPVVLMNPALAGSANSLMTWECVEQGAQAAKLLIDHLQANNVEMKGTVVFQSLPFVHLNAATRSKGFIDAFAEYPEVEIVELSGTSPEEHYTQFEGAIANYGENLIGAFGLYSSATIGMMNAAKAAGSDVPITSIDNDKVILEAIYNGELLGSSCYSSSNSSFFCLSAAINILNGVDVPQVYYGANTVVTKDNVEEMFELYYAGKTLADYMAGVVD